MAKPAPEINIKAPETTKSEASPPSVERKVRPMEDARFKGAEYGRELWLCTAFENTRPEDLTEPAYWAHLAMKLRPRARIEAWADDGTWLAEYVVLEAGRTWARVRMLQVYHLGTEDVAMTHAEAMSPYEITFRGPHAQWSVIRKSDREVLHDAEATQEGAVEWLKQRMKAGL